MDSGANGLELKSQLGQKFCLFV